MKILLTSAKSDAIHRISTGLTKSHTVTLSDRNHVSTNLQFIQSSLNHDAETNALVRNQEVVIHSLDNDSKASDSDILDAAMRCTYNLLFASVEEKVPKFIYISSLTLMDTYNEKYIVDESWEPMPQTNPSILRYHLAELVCREFSLEGNIDVIVLRFGEIVDQDHMLTQTKSALYVEDAINAINMAIKTSRNELNNKRLFHIQSKIPNGQYPTLSAENTLGYNPVKHI